MLDLETVRWVKRLSVKKPSEGFHIVLCWGNELSPLRAESLMVMWNLWTHPIGLNSTTSRGGIGTAMALAGCIHPVPSARMRNAPTTSF